METAFEVDVDAGGQLIEVDGTLLDQLATELARAAGVFEADGVTPDISGFETSFKVLVPACPGDGSYDVGDDWSTGNHGGPVDGSLVYGNHAATDNEAGVTLIGQTHNLGAGTFESQGMLAWRQMGCAKTGYVSDWHAGGHAASTLCRALIHGGHGHLRLACTSTTS